MQLFPKVITILACLLAGGGVGSLSPEELAGRSDGPRLVVLPWVELVPSPGRRPPCHDYMIVNQGESEINEEDTDEVEKPLAFSHLLFHSDTLQRSLPRTRSRDDRVAMDSCPVASVLRC